MQALIFKGNPRYRNKILSSIISNDNNLGDYIMNNVSNGNVRTDDVIGKEVKSPQLESLGDIKEIVLDKYSGQARYVVMTFGGLMGFGERYFAFPWKSISYNDNEECFILNIDESRLKKEYGFSKDEWPDVNTWSNTVDTYYP
jgi:hypothetical protein